MQANYKGLVDFLAGETICIIPVYQRNYDWQKSHCEQLFEDLERLIKNEKPEHFIGTVVFQEHEKKKIIIDGQQRITSIILLAKAVYDLSDNAEIRDRIFTAFIKNSKFDAEYKLKPSEFDREIFRKLMEGKTFSDTEFSRLYLNYKFFKEKLEDPLSNMGKKLFDNEDLRKKIYNLLKNDENFKSKISDADFEILNTDKELTDEKCAKIFSYFEFFKEEIQSIKLSAVREAITKFKIVALKLDGENPQEIFESLNSTGKDLTETELIRNFLLIDLKSDEQEKLYKKYWLQVEKMLRNSETFEKFMLQYLVSKRKSNKDMQDGKHIANSKNALYPTFKKYFEKNYGGKKAEQVENFLADMYGYAEFYSRLISLKDKNFESLSALDKKFCELIYLVGASSSPIILMDLNNKYKQNIFTEETFLQIVNALISYVFRAKVCKQSVDTEQNAANILKRFDDDKKFDVDSFWCAITEGNSKYSFPNDEEFKDALLSPELFLSLKVDKCKYLLYKLEKNSGNLNLPPYESGYRPYFVIPKKLNNAWKNYLNTKKDEDNHETYLNSLGNLVLTEDEKQDNSIFSEKRVKFATSKFNYTRNLKDYSDWTSREIRRRAKFLADLALKIWILPEQYQTPAAVENGELDLDIDFRILTGRKPEIFSMSNQQYQVNSWIDILRKISKELYYLDKNTFKQSLQTERISKLFSTTPETLDTSYKIDENFYIGAGIDTKTCLNFAKIIVENFDRLSGTTFKEEIWFTLKN